MGYKKFFLYLIKRRITIIALVILIVIIFMGILANYVMPYDPLKIDPVNRLEPPSSTHFFGTDNYGRDIFSRVIYGARITLISGGYIVLFTVILGVIIGTVSGYYNMAGNILMRIVDVLMAFPPLILALGLMAAMGRGLPNVIIAVGIVYFTRIARITQGLTMQIKEESYVESGRAIGLNDVRILLRYIIPNLISPIIVQATFVFAFSILQMASLDFLGVGLPPAIPSWGGMLSEGRRYLTSAPWILIFPGLSIVLVVLSLNLVGDALRDTLDPRFRSEIGK